MNDGADLIRSARFRQEREAGWSKLDVIVSSVERHGLRSLGFADARDLAQLYRQAMTSLAVAREISLDRSLLDYLDALCCRAYLAVYAPQQTIRGVLWRFIAQGAPAAVRRSAGVIGLASIAMILGGVVGYLLFLDDPTWYNTFVPGSLQGGRTLSSSRADLLAVIYPPDQTALGGLGAFASYLFSHNTQIAIMAFSLGIMACLPSFALAAYNGLILGAFVGLYVDRDLGVDLFGWLSVHGVTELSAIVIATAGGFRLGLAVLFPGRLTRKAALRHEGRDAAKLAIIAAFMLLVAALLEGFARQMITDLNTRIAVGWGVGALWLIYFLFAGRKPAGRS